ncbi:MAG: T9SS type A sorting domain-containing protein, partial [Bacteroidota bacterium]
NDEIAKQSLEQVKKAARSASKARVFPTVVTRGDQITVVSANAVPVKGAIIRVFDQNGRLISSQPQINRESYVSTDAFTSGVYIIQHLNGQAENSSATRVVVR